jgi:hypothetical protein
MGCEGWRENALVAFGISPGGISCPGIGGSCWLFVGSHLNDEVFIMQGECRSIPVIGCVLEIVDGL